MSLLEQVAICILMAGTVVGGSDSKFYRTAPHRAAAEQYAGAALVLVPHRHYVKDIPIPQIETAKIKIEIIGLERAALDRWGKGDPQGYLD